MELIQIMKFALLFILLTSNILSPPHVIIAGEIPAKVTSENREDSSIEQTARKPTPEQQERRKQMISASWIMLIGVAILGGILLLIVFLFGNRIRRIARKPLPNAPLRDPMWYLKNKANDTSELTDEAADTDHE